MALVFKKKSLTPFTLFPLRSVCLLGPVDPSFRAPSGRLKFTVRRHKFNKDSPSLEGEGCTGPPKVNWGGVKDFYLNTNASFKDFNLNTNARIWP